MASTRVAVRGLHDLWGLIGLIFSHCFAIFSIFSHVVAHHKKKPRFFSKFNHFFRFGIDFFRFWGGFGRVSGAFFDDFSLG